MPVLMGVSLNAQEGEIVSINGRHGSGKTALLRVIAGMQPISSGEAKVLGFDVRRLDYVGRQQLHLSVGLVFESSGLLSTRTIFDNIALPLAYHKPNVEAAPIVKAIAKELAFEHSLYLPTLEVTASVRKRAFLARALITEPDVLLVDEPQRALSDNEKEVVSNTIERRCKERGLTVVFADHDGDLRPYHIDRCITIEQGQLTR